MPNRMEYKEFDDTTPKGIKDAERHQQALYKRYDKVVVRPAGLSKTAVWGELSDAHTPLLHPAATSIMVLNLSTGKERHYVGLTPAQAVVTAAEQEAGNYDATKYDYSRAKLSPSGGTVAYGDWTAIVSKDAVLRQLRASKRAKAVGAKKPRLTR
jgi:hypothetical protein